MGIPTPKAIIEATLNKLAERMEEASGKIDGADMEKLIDEVRLAANYAGDGAMIAACNILIGERGQ